MAIPAALGLDPTLANAGIVFQRLNFESIMLHTDFYLMNHVASIVDTLGFPVHHAINDTMGSILPSGLQRTLLDGIFSIGRAQVSDFVLNEKNPLGSLRLAKLKQIFEGGESLQLQFPAEDLGFR